ncbi:unnamed protein product, partial [marine sediment metagenome]
MIVTHTDSRYLPWTRMYLESIANVAPDERVLVSGINLSKDEVLALCNLHKGTCVKNYHTDKLPAGSHKVHMQCRISQVLIQAYDSNLAEKYIVTNADMLLRRPLGKLYDKLDLYPLMLRLTTEHMKKKPPQ